MLLVSKPHISFLYPSVCMTQFTKQAKQIKLRLAAEQKLWGTPMGNPRLNSQHCISKEAVSTCWVGESLTHPGFSLTFLTLERKGSRPFFSLSPFELMRLQVWVNYFVQGQAATEGSQSTLHFTYCYAAFYFILPGRASEKRILKGYSN